MTDKTWDILELVVDLWPAAMYTYTTATTAGEHASGSYHYKGEALDTGIGTEEPSKTLLATYHHDRFDMMDQLAAWLYEDSGLITELLHTRTSDTGGWYVKNEKRVSGNFYGKVLMSQHINHVHLAVATRANAEKLLIKKVQRILGLTADGDAGPLTLKAIKTVQKNAKLSQDGAVGPLTVAALRKKAGYGLLLRPAQTAK